ncbi:MAG: hypothetical protein JSR31_15305 [Nitrospira sp.]|nr:hypothetical protein [Nitrospira sp.]
MIAFSKLQEMIKLLTNQPNKIRCHDETCGVYSQQYGAPMKRMGTATAPPPEQPSQKSTTVLVVIAGLLLVGLIYSVVVRDAPASCPNELVGAWITSANGYENGMLVFTKTGVLFSVGFEHLDAQAMRRIDVSTEGPRTLYTIVYGDSRRDEQTLSFYYHTKDHTITFKNQAHLVWTRKAVES